jgi:ATP-dependent helicase/DNAse subunit B
MPARVTVILGAVPARVRERLLDRFRAALRGPLGSALWVGPTPGAVDEARLRLLDGSHSSALVPPMHDWEGLGRALLRRLDPAALRAGPAQQRLLLHEAVADLRREKRLPYFERVCETRGFLEAAAGTLAELKRAGTDAETFAAAADDEKLAEIAAILGRYQALLDAVRRHDADDELPRALRLLREAPVKPFPNLEQVFVEGLCAADAVRFQLIEELAARVNRLHVALPDEAGDEREELFRRSRLTLERLTTSFPDAEIERLPDDAPGPAGLAHLRRKIFAAVEPSDDAAGVALIEAPGIVGEARMVARQIRLLLGAGTPADRILVAARRLDGNRDVLEEVFAEYRVPADFDGDEPLARDPLVAMLLRAVRLPEDDWLFASVTALLRSDFIRPDWPECGADREVPRHAEALLRMLGEPRGRETVLRAVELWADDPPPGLEDEQAEESRRQRKHRLAKQCRPFLRRFFRAWERFPQHGPPSLYVEVLGEFAAELVRVQRPGRLTPPLAPPRSGEGGKTADDDTSGQVSSPLPASGRGEGGLGSAPHAGKRPQPNPPGPPSRSGKGGERQLHASGDGAVPSSPPRFGEGPGEGLSCDDRALRSLRRELTRWATSSATPRSVSRAAFLRALTTIANHTPLPKLPRSGLVRVRDAEAAVGLAADHLFVIGLGEKSFPDLSPPRSLLDDGDRARLREAGLPLECTADRLPREMLLFHRLLALPEQQLVLSFPAVDEKGQPLLPSSFLRAAREPFAAGTMPVESARMLISVAASGPPVADAELRVRFAAAMAHAPAKAAWKHPHLRPELTVHLRDAHRMARSRFDPQAFDAYDGWLEDSKLAAAVLNERFGPERVFSPTALEAYVACPFKFFLSSVLGLAPLEEPVEEVEHSRRGSAFHRALARFHRKLHDEGRHLPSASSPEELFAEIDTAVKEYQSRAPSEAGKVLWRLEGERLRRFAAKYHGHWQGFVAPWSKQQADPRPAHLEADFGLAVITPDGQRLDPELPALTISVGGIEVKIGGRIDRIDVAELEDGIGFWIIDYKTGKAKNYSGEKLKNFEKLQLTLYALAVERTFFPGQNARPLGLAYWLVTDKGPKHALPGKPPLAWLSDPEQWPRFRAQLEAWVAEVVGHVRRGHFPLSPRSDDCTETCDFGRICRITQLRATGRSFDFPLPVLPSDGAAEGGDVP